MLLRWLLPLLFCTGVQAAPTAATPMFRHFGVDDGLPSSIVYKLAEDRDGFVWIGTYDGLARYDGVDFASGVPCLTMTHRSPATKYRHCSWIATTASGPAVKAVG